MHAHAIHSRNDMLAAANMMEVRQQQQDFERTVLGLLDEIGDVSGQFPPLPDVFSSSRRRLDDSARRLARSERRERRRAARGGGRGRPGKRWQWSKPRKYSNSAHPRKYSAQYTGVVGRRSERFDDRLRGRLGSGTGGRERRRHDIRCLRCRRRRRQEQRGQSAHAGSQVRPAHGSRMQSPAGRSGEGSYAGAEGSCRSGGGRFSFVGSFSFAGSFHCAAGRGSGAIVIPVYRRWSGVEFHRTPCMDSSREAETRDLGGF